LSLNLRYVTVKQSKTWLAKICATRILGLVSVLLTNKQNKNSERKGEFKDTHAVKVLGSVKMGKVKGDVT